MCVQVRNTLWAFFWEGPQRVKTLSSLSLSHLTCPIAKAASRGLLSLLSVLPALQPISFRFPVLLNSSANLISDQAGGPRPFLPTGPSSVAQSDESSMGLLAFRTFHNPVAVYFTSCRRTIQALPSRHSPFRAGHLPSGPCVFAHSLPSAWNIRSIKLFILKILSGCQAASLQLSSPQPSAAL